MKISDERTIQVSVRLSFPVGRDTRRGQLTIEDEASGIRFVEIPLTAEQLMDLMSNSAAKTTAIIPDNLERIGRHYKWEVVKVPDGIHGHVYGRDPSDEMKAAAEACLAGDDGTVWDGSRWTRHNFGWQLARYRWVEGD